MKLRNIFSLCGGSVVSIVGAGGKTSLLFSLAEEFRSKYKVLVTTTTKIYVPKEKQYDFIACKDDEDLVEEYCRSKRKGIYVLGSRVTEENKLLGLDDTRLNKALNCFDYVLIEADGSKRKPIKGWNDKEPIIINNTTATIGILDIQVLGKKIDEKLVHRMDKFLELTGAEKDCNVEIRHLESLVSSPKGLFKNAAGEKILFINKVERVRDFSYAEELAQSVLRGKLAGVDRIMMGSLKNNYYALINK